MTLSALLATAVQRDPDGVIIVGGNQHYRYADLARQASGLAITLRDLGVRPCDRVAVYLEKSWEAVVAMFGTAIAGGTFVNINPLLKARQVQHILNNAEPRVVIADAAKLSNIQLGHETELLHLGQRSELVPDARQHSLIAVLDRADGLAAHGVSRETDLATILYTSGSTGQPKGIMCSHRNLTVGARIVSSYLENTAQDRVLSVLPFSFDYGLNQLLTMVHVGGTLVLQRSSLPGALLSSLRRERITGLAGVPPVWVLLLQARRALEAEPLSELRYITNSGGAVPLANVQALRDCLPATRIYLMYGLTEAFRSTYLPPDELDRRPTSMGRAIPETEIWVLDDQNRPCTAGQVGELVHRGPTVSLGYWRNEEATRQAFRPNPFAPESGERVVYSGDLVRWDDEGFLQYVGRRDEQIKTEGYRVSPQEIEDLVLMLPEVKEAVAFGIPNERSGYKIAVALSLQAGASRTAEDIVRHVRDCAPAYMVPAHVAILPELPKGATGKLDRARVKAEITAPVLVA
ncbi:MAG: AMP-binding protein [Chloroflexota bacterium]